ncbi:hypothetical protein [Limnohabitans radicicola]|nr:hypothetical protein [Limnohabitans radicicola]
MIIVKLLLQTQEIYNSVDFSDVAKRIRAMKRAPSQTIFFGHDVPKDHLTLAGYLWLGVYLGLPVVILGNLLDLLMQKWFGWCIGFWCIL